MPTGFARPGFMGPMRYGFTPHGYGRRGGDQGGGGGGQDGDEEHEGKGKPRKSVMRRPGRRRRRPG